MMELIAVELFSLDWNREVPMTESLHIWMAVFLFIISKYPDENTGCHKAISWNKHCKYLHIFSFFIHYQVPLDQYFNIQCTLLTLGKQSYNLALWGVGFCNISIYFRDLQLWSQLSMETLLDILERKERKMGTHINGQYM